MHLLEWRLSSSETSRHLSVLLLTLVTTTRRLSLAGRGTSTSSDTLVVGFRDVAEITKDGGMPDLGSVELADEGGGPKDCPRCATYPRTLQPDSPPLSLCAAVVIVLGS